MTQELNKKRIAQERTVSGLVAKYNRKRLPEYRRCEVEMNSTTYSLTFFHGANQTRKITVNLDSLYMIENWLRDAIARPSI